MSKQIQAYFRTEDEAEGARMTLITYKTEKLEVGQLQEAVGRGTNILVPLVPLNAAGLGGSTTGTGSVGGVAGTAGAIVGTRDVTDLERSEDAPASEFDEWVDAADLIDADYRELKYVLSAKVNDTDYEDIVRMLRSNHAYVERFD
ncbi:hypothetical protein SAMN05661091_4521 [Paenibacillus uliginis N3/975]|uniref:Uncharacterized protein n=1 Tax=Paenibacillus uliginis N3/975 TaxID=1313296 RepID=A0A1X7HNS2_9BACL|nr:hypothetical protein [Paenibacillus uliginis]SMF89088.1 hypothetical protein SAMN05661091_4521 [Paenibacillus uliginis N3/975]